MFYTSALLKLLDVMDQKLPSSNDPGSGLIFGPNAVVESLQTNTWWLTEEDHPMATTLSSTYHIISKRWDVYVLNNI